MANNKEMEKFQAFIEERITHYSQSSTIHAQNGEYESAQYALGIADGLQLAWDYLNGIKTKELK